MKKINLLFDVKDSEYFRKLREYIMLNYNLYFNLSPEKDNRESMCIISDYLNKRNNRNIFIIGEDKYDISKYRKASEICAALIEKYSLAINGIVSPGQGGLRLICVTSALGGAGKSTISKAICCRLAEKGEKVLYLNPDSFSSGEPVFEEREKNSYTRLRYYIRQRRENIGTVMENLATRDITRRVDYIVNSKPSLDGFIGQAEAIWLIENIKNKSAYNIMVVDLPSHLSDGHMEIMRHADMNVIIQKTAFGNRQGNFIKYIELMGVLTPVIVNNFSDEGELSIPESTGIFDMYPAGFWHGINNICNLPGVGK